ncbi:hypothetical protein Tco_0750604 [Tanacetum coccineum]|uniref:Uncharacterized protein n=1 Tax=Tanacetum coccineum TaxID=301880 RepID=A0ABQ4Z535_9ASTR
MADNRTMVSIAQEKRHPPGTPAAWVDFLDKMPRECLKNIESKSKVRQNTKQGSPLPKYVRALPPQQFHPMLPELKDLVRALL